MESAQDNLEQAARALAMARQREAVDLQAATFWLDEATAQIELANAKRGFGLGLNEQRPPLTEDEVVPV